MSTRRRRRSTATTTEAPQPSTKETRWGVFRNPGPGMFTEELGGEVPRHCYPTAEVSLPPEVHEEAKSKGLEFVRWAR